MKPVVVDLSLEDVARIKNALDPIDPQDYVTKSFGDANYGATSGAENFSFHKIVTGKTVKIEAEQHMICTSLEIDGFLDVEGAVVML
jgi:hypothetical protein